MSDELKARIRQLESADSLRSDEVDRLLEMNAALRAEIERLRKATKPVAWVPVHPREGALWAMTSAEPRPERLPSYPLTPLYVLADDISSKCSTQGVMP